MTDPVLIVDRTALEEPVPEGTAEHSLTSAVYGDNVVRLRQFVVLADAQLMVPCPNHTDRLFQGGWCSCGHNGPGTIPAPVGSTYHDVEIAERCESDGSNGNGSPWVETSVVPFARVRTVHVVPQQAFVYDDELVTTWAWSKRDNTFYANPDLFDSLPDGDPLFVLDHVEAL